MIKWGNCWYLQRPHGLKETLTPDQPPTFPILPWRVWSTTNSLLAFKTLYMEDVCFQVSYKSKDKFKTWRESGKKKRHCLFLASLFFIILYSKVKKFALREFRSCASFNLLTWCIQTSHVMWSSSNTYPTYLSYLTNVIGTEQVPSFTFLPLYKNMVNSSLFSKRWKLSWNAFFVSRWFFVPRFWWSLAQYIHYKITFTFKV
jgi:hypothetical protein